MSRYRDVRFPKTPSAKRAPDVRKAPRRPANAEARASAGRIVDLLQQLVIARPEMVVPLEEIVRRILVNLAARVEKGTEQRDEGILLDELPALRGLLESPQPSQKATSTRAVKKSSAKRKRC